MHWLSDEANCKCYEVLFEKSKILAPFFVMYIQVLFAVGLDDFSQMITPVLPWLIQPGFFVDFSIFIMSARKMQQILISDKHNALLVRRIRKNIKHNKYPVNITLVTYPQNRFFVKSLIKKSHWNVWSLLLPAIGDTVWNIWIY